MAPTDQKNTASATSSQTKAKAKAKAKKSSSKNTKRAASTAIPRLPDEIEEADAITPVKTAPKQEQTRVESSSDKDTDDAESVYLSSDEEDSSSDYDSSDYDSDSDNSAEELPPRQLVRRSTNQDVKHTTGSPFIITQTRSETTRWISTQNNGGMTRGTRSVNEQTTMHGQNVNGPQQRPGNRNSVSFNMSFNVDMSFNGLVTGRNLGFTGGSLSYAWNRRSTQGG
ncbi:hypothetical protein FHETE_7766 [Fusarium heterosporum]|uniref:Uncharacterized protein n=1 Tax=Fusarium heterosporum TaxID=42747 RepID=A0A8H5T569_FUSHE|nr:hypothetical protein FHETE_7766 [Fusarium heterosporum]